MSWETEVEIVFKNPNTGEEKTLGASLKELLERSVDDFYEALDDTEPCTSASCNNESQNFCDCGSYFEDFEIVDIRISNDR